MKKLGKEIVAIEKWLSEDNRKIFQKNLLEWYEQHQRDLPWRLPNNLTPYRVLVSEIMLHQTQVQTVIPIYEHFIKRFSTIEILANASLKEIKDITDPLGYKSRSNWLKEIAEIIVNERHGEFPKTLEELQKLPGVGRYTAGAIMSFAFQQDAPIVDTNVERVLSRICGVYKIDFPKPVKYQRVLWALAQYVIPLQTGYIFNQAIMDFGATLCIARNPRCSVCLMRIICCYYKSQPQQLSIDQFFPNHSDKSA